MNHVASIKFFNLPISARQEYWPPCRHPLMNQAFVIRQSVQMLWKAWNITFHTWFHVHSVVFASTSQPMRDFWASFQQVRLGRAFKLACWNTRSTMQGEWVWTQRRVSGCECNSGKKLNKDASRNWVSMCKIGKGDAGGERGYMWFVILRLVGEFIPSPSVSLSLQEVLPHDIRADSLQAELCQGGRVQDCVSGLKLLHSWPQLCWKLQVCCVVSELS